MGLVSRVAFLEGELKNLIKQPEAHPDKEQEVSALGDRISHLEPLTVVKEGVRRRLDRFSDSLRGFEERLLCVEEETYSHPCRAGDHQSDGGTAEDPFAVYGRGGLSTEAGWTNSGEAKDRQKFLEEFRGCLAEGAPVHLGGLPSRADLNGRPAIVGKWDQGKGRWGICIGNENLLIKPDNLFP